MGWGGGGGGECRACLVCSAGQVHEYGVHEDEAGLNQGFSRLDFP